MFGGCSELNCIYDKHTYSQVISVFEYNDFSKKIITSFKFNDNFRLLKLFKSWLSYIISNVDYSDITYIIHVPLHKTKLKIRGFNQSLILAKIASRILGINYKNNILVKIKNTENQSDLNKSLREKNLKEAFSVNLKYKKLIEDKKVLLIDDIITTGSTANECSKTLLNNGAKEVRVISLAKR